MDPIEVIVEKLVHGGQGLGSVEGGKKALIWNALPGETVQFERSKSRSSYLEGIATHITKPSAEREEPRDDLYLSTSPWQMMTYDAENKYKLEILQETLTRAHVKTSCDRIKFLQPERQWGYRNKMEYSFYGDDDGLHLALFNRGSHQKQIVTGSSIAMPSIDEAANKLVEILDKNNIRASSLKSVIVRSDQAGNTVLALFTRDEKFPKITELESVGHGIAVCFSNPKSPASVLTRELYRFGNIELEDNLLDNPIRYNVFSFFQINLDPYQKALQSIKSHINTSKLVDFYAGVGSIGLSVAPKDPVLIELDEQSVEMSKQNIAASKFKNAKIVLSSSDKAVEHIPSRDATVIFDPPRAGMHHRLVEAVLEKLPKQIIYLSCNPSTMARDLELLQKSYKIEQIEGYNFFPRTPHIEALAVLERV